MPLFNHPITYMAPADEIFIKCGMCPRCGGSVQFSLASDGPIKIGGYKCLDCKMMFINKADVPEM